MNRDGSDSARVVGDPLVQRQQPHRFRGACDPGTIEQLWNSTARITSIKPTPESKRSCASKAGVQPEVPLLDLCLQVCNEIRIGVEHLQDRQNHAWAVRAIGEDDHP